MSKNAAMLIAALGPMAIGATMVLFDHPWIGGGLICVGSLFLPIWDRNEK